MCYVHMWTGMDQRTYYINVLIWRNTCITISKKDECQVGCGRTPPSTQVFRAEEFGWSRVKSCFSLKSIPPQLWLTQQMEGEFYYISLSSWGYAIHLQGWCNRLLTVTMPTLHWSIMFALTGCVLLIWYKYGLHMLLNFGRYVNFASRSNIGDLMVAHLAQMKYVIYWSLADEMNGVLQFISW